MERRSKYCAVTGLSVIRVSVCPASGSPHTHTTNNKQRRDKQSKHVTLQCNQGRKKIRHSNIGQHPNTPRSWSVDVDREPRVDNVSLRHTHHATHGSCNKGDFHTPGTVLEANGQHPAAAGQRGSRAMQRIATVLLWGSV
jgi:hypothetical protein